MPDAPQTAVDFSGDDLIRLFAATYLPLCDQLEAAGALDRARLADAMSLYVSPGDTGTGAAMVEALQIVLRRPRPEPPTPRAEPVLRVILGGRG